MTPPVQLNCYLPGEVAGNACNASKAKTGLPVGKMIVLGLLAGAYIGFGAYLATTVSHDVPAYLGNGISQLLLGSVFTVGLMLVIIAGAELFTGNNMFMMVGALEGTIGWGSLVKNWIIIWVFNFVGALILVFLVFGAFYAGDAPGLFGGGVGAKAVAIAKGKVELTWFAAFFRAILCNWLVCLAVWLALASKDVIGKIFGIFFPIMAFVTMGMEHSVANMFFIPMGLMIKGNQTILEVAAATATDPEAYKAAVQSNLTWGALFVKNLIPVTIGNIIGGAIFVGTSYWYSFLRKPKSPPAAD